MKIIFLVILTLFFTACTPEAPVDKPDDGNSMPKTTKLRVLTYNIFGARDGGVTASQLNDIAMVIKRVDPHLVALQEVDVNTRRTGVGRNIAQELAGLCGMEYFFAKAMNWDGGEYGDAILSSLPIKETKAYTMTVLPAFGGESRSVAQVKVTVNNQDLYFISTHFDHKFEENRTHQSNQLVKILEKLELPVIMGGDFNAEPDAESIRILANKMKIGCGTNCKQFRTFSVSKPQYTIDYIMSSVSPALAIDYYGVENWATTQSDHFPVYAIYSISNSQN